jgi:hypothetical protein
MIIAKTNLIKKYKITFLGDLVRFRCKKKLKKIILFVHFLEIYKYEIIYFKQIIPFRIFYSLSFLFIF